jgi:hypothetical protein
MTLRVSAVCEWLVARGFNKIDTIANHPNRFAHLIRPEAYWLFAEAPECGQTLLNINLAAGELSPRIGLTLFADATSGVVESIDISGSTVGSVAGITDATALTLADLPHLLELLPSLAEAVTTAQAEGRPLSDDDLIARSDQCNLLLLVEVD